MRAEELLGEIAAFDARGADVETIGERERLVEELAVLCRQQGMGPTVGALEGLLKRTLAMQSQVAAERVHLGEQLQGLETQLRQLRSFGGAKAGAEGELLNRLA